MTRACFQAPPPVTSTWPTAAAWPSALQPFGWEPDRLARCLDAIEQHHAQASRWKWGAEVELVRRSDLVELSRGLINFGVDRGWLRDLFREVSRRGLYRLIATDLFRRDGRHLAT